MEAYTGVVGENQKFNEDGTFRWFPGNTMICDLSHHRNVMKAIRLIHERYKSLPFASKFVCMPHDSIHMTVFEFVCHFNRDKSHWSAMLELDAPIEETDRFFAERLADVEMPDNFTMKLDSVGSGGLLLSPADQAIAACLREFRDRVGQATGVKFPNHDTYEYHISHSYQLVHLTPEEEAYLTEVRNELTSKIKEVWVTFNTGHVLYTLFKDMSKFVPYRPDARASL